jgi:hypothetical protein
LLQTNCPGKQQRELSLSSCLRGGVEIDEQELIAVNFRTTSAGRPAEKYKEKLSEIILLLTSVKKNSRLAYRKVRRE